MDYQAVIPGDKRKMTKSSQKVTFIRKKHLLQTDILCSFPQCMLLY